MTTFHRSGNSFTIAGTAPEDIYETLPPGNYLVRQNLFGFYLEQMSSFVLPKKLYGKTDRHAERIMTTFEARDRTTGCLFAGEKGSGKTLLAMRLAHLAAHRGYPTLIVNEPFCGDDFNRFIKDIDQPCVVFFDEFEKTYDSDDQEKLLSLLDGAFTSKKLIMMTCNDLWSIDDNMRNRPGRIFYLLTFNGLEAEFVREYCEDNLDNKTNIDGVCRTAELHANFNFDMLKALVEEMNRYNETAQEALEMLNSAPGGGEGDRYTVSLMVNDVAVPADQLSTTTWAGDPFTEGAVHIYYSPKPVGTADVDDDEEGLRHTMFRRDDMVGLVPGTSSIMYKNAEGMTATLTRIRRDNYNYRNLLA